MSRYRAKSGKKDKDAEDVKTEAPVAPQPSLLATIFNYPDQSVLASAAGIFALTFLAYVITTSTAVRGGNDGHLVASVANLAVPHSPGYPLYLALGKLYSLIPISTIPFRLGVMNCVLQAGTNLLVFVTLWMWTHNLLCSVVASLAYGCVPLHWNLANSVSVWPLNTLLIVAAIALTVGYFRTRRGDCVTTLALVVGLGLSNEPTSAFVTLPLLLVCYDMMLKESGPRGGRMHPDQHSALQRQLVQQGLVGLSPYLLIPILGLINPTQSWGNTASLTGFFQHVFHYEGVWLELMVPPNPPSLESWASRVGLALLSTGREVGIPGLCLAMAGAADAWRMRKVPGRVLPYVFAFYVFAIAFLVRVGSYDLAYGVLSQYWVVSNAFLAIWAGIGLNSLQRGRLVPESPLWTYFPLFILILTASLTGMRFSQVNHRNNSFVQETGRELLQILPQNSVIIFDGGLSRSPLTYLHEVEGVRPDVQLFDLRKASYPWYLSKNSALRMPHNATRYYRQGHTPDHIAQSDVYTLQELFLENLPHMRGRLFSFQLPPQDGSWFNDVTLVPVGLAERIEVFDITQALQDWSKIVANPPKARLPSLGEFDTRFYEAELVYKDENARQNLGSLLISYAYDNKMDQSALKAGIALLQPIVEDKLNQGYNHPEEDLAMIKNMALALGKLQPPQHKASRSLLIFYTTAIQPFAEVNKNYLQAYRDTRAMIDRIEELIVLEDSSAGSVE